jgi:hypothetical protein
VNFSSVSGAGARTRPLSTVATAVMSCMAGGVPAMAQAQGAEGALEKIKEITGPRISGFTAPAPVTSVYDHTGRYYIAGARARF